MENTSNLGLSAGLFGTRETVVYGLNMMGAKGSLKLNVSVTGDTIELRCQILASLILPPKKLVDSELTSKLENRSDGTFLVRHTDSDFKSESRRTLELKKNGIETRYIKFDEERGYLDYPKDARLQEIVDPLTALFTIRSEGFLKEGREAVARVLTRTGVLDVLLRVVDSRTTEVGALGGERKQLRLQLMKLSGGEPKGPYLSQDLEIWIDTQTGLVTEVTYPFLGVFGRGSLLLETAVLE